MLKIENLTLHYGHSQILNGISLGAAQGEVRTHHRAQFPLEDGVIHR